jgi:hypothetical protein
MIKNFTSGQRQIKTKLITRSRFHGYGFEAPLHKLEEYVSFAESIELYSEEKVVFLDIRHGGLFHQCSLDEWNQFIVFLIKNSFISVDSRFPWRSVRWQIFAIIGWLLLVKGSASFVKGGLINFPDIVTTIVWLIYFIPFLWIVLSLHNLLNDYREDARVSKLVKQLTIGV